MEKYEEHKKWNTFWSWATVFAISGGLLTWATIMMVFVEQAPREWDFGNLEFTPAKSVYSTNNPDEKAGENMIEPLPDGISMEEAKKLKHENK